MITLTAKGQIYAAVLVVGWLGGLASAWALWRPAAPIREVAALAVRQRDSSLLVRRNPDTAVTIHHQLPPHAKPERELEVSVNPLKPVILHDTLWVPAAPGEPPKPVVKVDTVFCPPVRVEATYLEMADHTHRVVVSSPDGRVNDSLTVDIPLGPARAPPRALPWSAGVLRVQDAGWGGYVSRDVGPFRVLAGGLQGFPHVRPVILLGAGLRF